MYPIITETIPQKWIIEASREDLLLLAAAVFDDATTRDNWTVYNRWHAVLDKFYPKEEA